MGDSSPYNNWSGPRSSDASSYRYRNQNSSIGTSWNHPTNGPPPSAVHHQQSNNLSNNLESHLKKLHEDQQHERMAKNQKSKLLQKNLESLRALVQEIQEDDWKYARNDSEDVMSEYFTRLDAWGSK